jgi:hypothetical protein
VAPELGREVSERLVPDGSLPAVESDLLLAVEVATGFWTQVTGSKGV